MSNDIQISEREREILRLVATGATNQQIAQQLNISINTVKVHLRNIFGKIGVVSRTEATVYALRNRLIDADVVVAPALDADEPVPADGAPAPVAPAPVAPAPVAPADVLPAADAPSTPAPAAELRAPALADGVPTSTPLAPPSPQRQSALLLSLAGLSAVLLLAVIVLLLSRPLDPVDPTPASAASTAPASEDSVQRWFSRAPLPMPRDAFALAAYDTERQLYVIGGQSQGRVSGAVDRYDPGSDRWVSLAEKPTSVSHAGAISLRGQIYVPGGEDADGQVSTLLEIYDPREQRWTRGADLPAPRSRYALTVWEGQLYLIGGWDGAEPRAEVFIYDPVAGSWSDGPTLPTARRGAGVAISQGRIYLVGGEASSGPLRDNLRLDPTLNSGRWETLVPLPEPVAAPGVASSIGAVIVFDSERRKVVQYDQATDAWLPIDVPPTAALSPATVLLGTSIFFVGGATATPPGATAEYQVTYNVFVPGRTR